MVAFLTSTATCSLRPAEAAVESWSETRIPANVVPVSTGTSRMAVSRVGTRQLRKRQLALPLPTGEHCPAVVRSLPSSASLDNNLSAGTASSTDLR
ncbi:hypothetical protein GXW82_39550 [Streptacidiphilus sp. 4-A2]|nr:hypothetical protein [Streptacidiphilus sp. 4-A2]